MRVQDASSVWLQLVRRTALRATTPLRRHDTMRQIHKIHFRLMLAWCMATPFTVSAQATAVLQSATLSFSGHATVGSFIGTTHTATGAVTGDLSGARGWVEAQVATLVTHNDRRDRDLRASMEVTKYP